MIVIDVGIGIRRHLGILFDDGCKCGHYRNGLPGSQQVCPSFILQGELDTAFVGYNSPQRSLIRLRGRGQSKNARDLTWFRYGSAPAEINPVR